MLSGITSHREGKADTTFGRLWIIAIVSLFLFAAEFFGYVAVRGDISKDLFGGDTVNVSLRQGDSYTIHQWDISAPKNFYSRLFQGRTEDSEKEIAAFVYKRLSLEGKRALERLSQDPSSNRDMTLFLLDLHKSLIEKDIEWPEEILVKLDMARSPTSEPVQQYNRRVLDRAFDSIVPTGPLHFTRQQLLAKFPVVAKYYFTQSQPTRFSPLTNIYVHMVQLLCRNSPERIRIAMYAIGVIYAMLMTLIFLLAFNQTESIPWSLLSVFLFQFCMSSITMSYLVFALPYMFVPLVMSGAFLGYLQFKKTGRLLWLAVFIMFAVIGPWFREFPGAMPFIVFACEILTFRRWQSAIILSTCILLMVHSVYPSLIPWLVGINSGNVHGVYEQVNAVAQTSGARLHWEMFGFFFVQFPPILWGLTLGSIGYWLWRRSRYPLPGTVKIPVIEKELRCGFLNSGWTKPVLFGACGLLFLAAICSYVYCFYIDNQDVERAQSIHAGYLLLPLIGVFLLASFRFSIGLPVYVLLVFPAFLLIQLAEVHLAFILFPVAILIAFWLRDLFFSLSANLMGIKRIAALLTVIVLLGIALIDHGLNLSACLTTQKRLVETNKAMAKWIQAHVPKHSIVISNFYNFTDVFYYSGYHFDPYESKANCPMGPGKVIDNREELQELFIQNQGFRDIYFLAAEHDFYSWQQHWDPHPFVRKPPGRITKLVSFSARSSYTYADPLKRLTPQPFVSFPGYMDWLDDFYVNNLPCFFRRLVYSDYTLYRLIDLAEPDPVVIGAQEQVLPRV